MTPYEKYVLVLCLVVFVLLTTVFTYMLISLLQANLRLIGVGAEDKRIVKEYKKAKSRANKKIDRFATSFTKVVTAVFLSITVLIFTFTTILQLTESQLTSSIPTMRVVYSESMSKKHDKNKYLFENDLNDQFSRFDLIVTYKLPDEMDLKLYDIVVYEVDDVLLVHRIVAIEEPNSKHPNERHFVLQGDYVEYPDKIPVLYSQMKAIYTGERVRFVGSFIMFMQSPAGYICLILMVVSTLASPKMRKKLEEAEQKRIELYKSKHPDQGISNNK